VGGVSIVITRCARHNLPHTYTHTQYVHTLINAWICALGGGAAPADLESAKAALAAAAAGGEGQLTGKSKTHTSSRVSKTHVCELCSKVRLSPYPKP
jgi:hypothetical protein